MRVRVPCLEHGSCIRVWETGSTTMQQLPQDRAEREEKHMLQYAVHEGKTRVAQGSGGGTRFISSRATVELAGGPGMAT